MKWFISSLALLLSFVSYAESSSKDSDTLGIQVWVSSACPFNASELKGRIEGEYVRARIKPTDDTDFYLTTNVTCLRIENKGGNVTGTAVSYEIRFGYHNSHGESMLYEYPSFGSMLVGGKGAETNQFFLNAIKESSASALTELLKARM